MFLVLYVDDILLIGNDIPTWEELRMHFYCGKEDELVVNGYIDASFQTDKDDFRSQSGYVFCLNGGAVSWRSTSKKLLLILQ